MRRKFACFAAAIGSLAAFFVLISASANAQKPASTTPRRKQPPRVRVAVFAQPGFPFYGANPTVAPQQIAADLRAAGVAAELLDADALARPDRFNASRYAAVVLTYGNTYPADAFANLQRFHHAGGSLVTTGIPFTHAADQIRARAGAARPAFVNAFIWNWGSTLGDLKKTLELLGPNYVAVTPSQLNALYRETNTQ